jgi:hypothetical protein
MEWLNICMLNVYNKLNLVIVRGITLERGEEYGSIRDSEVQVYEIADLESGGLNWNARLFSSLKQWNG